MMARKSKIEPARHLPARASQWQAGGHLGSYVTSQPEELSAEEKALEWIVLEWPFS
jgi:hypothetical protein